jgi:hypothetical protein
MGILPTTLAGVEVSRFEEVPGDQLTTWRASFVRRDVKNGVYTTAEKEIIRKAVLEWAGAWCAWGGMGHRLTSPRSAVLLLQAWERLRPVQPALPSPRLARREAWREHNRLSLDLRANAGIHTEPVLEVPGSSPPPPHHQVRLGCHPPHVLPQQ